MGEGHPECPERLSAIYDHLLMRGLLDLMLSEQIKKPADPAIFFTNEFAADYVKFDTAAIAAQAKAAK